jgi:hypothetical protein
MDEGVRAVQNMVQTVTYIENTHHDIFFKLKELKDMVETIKSNQETIETAVEESIKEFVFNQAVEPKKPSRTKKPVPVEEVPTSTQAKFSFKRGRPEGLE